MKQSFKVLVKTSSLLLMLSLFAPQAHADGHAKVDIMQSLQSAFAYSPKVKASLENKVQAKEQIKQAKAGHLPTLDAWAGAGFAQEESTLSKNDNTFDDVIETAEVGMTLSLSLWSGGKTSALVRGRESAYEAANLQALDTSNTLAFDTISAHVDLIRRQELVKLAQGHVNAHNHTLSLLRSRVAQGLSSTGEVDQVLGRLNIAKATLLAHKESLEAAQINYRRITGQAAPASLAPVAMPSVMYKNIEELNTLCLTNNYKIRSLFAQIDEITHDKDASESAYLPQLSFDAGPSYTSKDTSGDKDIVAWDAMINLRWNLYSGGEDTAIVAASNANIRGAKQSLHDAKDMLEEQVRRVFNRAQTAKEQETFYVQARKASAAARNNFNAQFKVGKRDLLSVLDAETETFAASTEAVLASSESLLAQYQLHALAGTLFEELQISPVVE